MITNLGRKGFMWFTQCSSSLREARTGAQGRNWRRVHCFLAYFPRLAQLAFFYTSQDHQPRDNTSHSRLKPVTSIVNQENDPHTERDLLQANAVEAFSCLMFPIPKWLWLMSSWQDKKLKNKTNQQKTRGSKLRSFNPDGNKTRAGLKTEQCG